MKPKYTDELIWDYRVAVFVSQGKHGYSFRAYTRDYSPQWSGCNVLSVKATSGKEAKAKAIATIKARMDLKSKLVPTVINCTFDE